MLTPKRKGLSSPVKPPPPLPEPEFEDLVPVYRYPQAKKGAFFAVIVGTTVGVLFGDYSTHIQPLVTGVSGSKFKKYQSKTDAIRAYREAEADGEVEVVEAKSASEGTDDKGASPPLKRVVKGRGSESGKDSDEAQEKKAGDPLSSLVSLSASRTRSSSSPPLGTRSAESSPNKQVVSGLQSLRAETE